MYMQRHEKIKNLAMKVNWSSESDMKFCCSEYNVESIFLCFIFTELFHVGYSFLLF